MVNQYVLEKATFLEQKETGLKRRCKKGTKVNFILEVEELWERYSLATYSYEESSDEALADLIDQLAFTIRNKVIAATNRWRNKRISSADFESVFIETVWQLCEKYTGYGVFYFYETLELSWRRREIDVVRKETINQTELGLKDGFDFFYPDTRNVEKEVTDRLFVEQILSYPSLEPIETQLLSIMYEYPDSSYREIAHLMGFYDHKKVIRMLHRIKLKLERYEEDLLYEH